MPSSLVTVMALRNEYHLSLKINGKQLSRVVISQHYRLKHSDINDELILRLLKTLDAGEFEIQERKGSFEYFAVEPVWLDEKPYRLVLCMSKEDDFLGVVNAFRRSKK